MSNNPNLPQPYRDPSGGQYQPPMYPPHIIVSQPPTSGYAVASMVFGILGMLGGFCVFGIPCVIAVILGHAGLIETRDGVKGGRGMAVAGLILGYLFVAPAIFIIVTGGIGAAVDTVHPSPTPTP